MRVLIVASFLITATGWGQDLKSAGQRIVPPFDVNKLIRTVHSNRTGGWPSVGEFLVDTTFVYKRAEYNQEVPTSSFDGANYLVVWQDISMPNGTHGVFGARLSREGKLLDSAGILVSKGAYDHIEPSVAFDGVNYVVVWRRQRANGESCDVCGARVNTAGSLIDTTCIPISAFDHLEIEPAVAFGGANHLVAWVDYRHGIPELYGARINRQGRILDSFGILISTPGGGSSQPAVAFDGRNYFVVWSQLDSVAIAYDICGRRLDQNGVVIDSATILISTAHGSQFAPALTFDGTNYLVVWEDDRRGVDSFDIYGARVGQDGILLDTAGLSIARGANRQQFPQISWNGRYFLVVWEEFGNGLDVYCARVTPSGTVLDPAGIPISTSASTPSIASDGSRWLAAWVGWRRHGPYVYPNIYGSRIDPDGAVLDTGILVSTAASSQRSPAVAFGETNYLVVWTDKRSSSGYDDLYGMRLDHSGNACDPAPIVVCGEPGGQGDADVAFDGSNYLAVWDDSRYTYTSIYGARISGEGAVLDPQGFQISLPSCWRSSPSLAHGNSDYLVVWQDWRSSSLDIYGARVTSGGTVLDPLGIRLSRGAGNERNPAVVFDGSNYLVVWDDDEHGYDIRGTRVSQAGQVLDPNGIPVSCAAEGQSDPSVAFGGSQYFVVWGDGRNGFDSVNIYGTRVTPTGVVLDTGGIPIARAPYWQYEPAVVYDGANYVVLWTDRRNGWFTHDIRGARIDTDGAIIDSFILSDQEGIQMSPRVAHGMGSQVLSVYSGWAERINRHPASTMRIWGKLLPEVGIGEEAGGKVPGVRFGLRVFPTPALSRKVRIEYVVPKTGKVKLVVYNALGQAEEVLVDCRAEPGVYERALKKELPSGVYFVQFVSETKSLTRKLVVIE